MQLCRESKHFEHSALGGGDGDPGKTLVIGRRRCRLQGFVLRREPLLECPVDGVPCWLLRACGVHAGSIPDRGSPRLAWRTVKSERPGPPAGAFAICGLRTWVATRGCVRGGRGG